MKTATLFLVAFVVLYSCKKQTNVTTKTAILSYTNRLAGTHTWTGTAGNYGLVNHPDTTYSDTLDQAISVVNDSTVIVSMPSPYSLDTSHLLDTLRYSQASDSFKTITFESQYNFSPGQTHITRTVTFAYAKDSASLHLYYDNAGHVSWTDVHSKIK